MALGSQLPIRLAPDVEARLEQAARAAGTTKSAIIRLLAETFVDQVVKDGKVTLPLDWAELLPQRDARSSKAKDSAGQTAAAGKPTKKRKPKSE